MDIDKKIRALLEEFENDPLGGPSPEMFQHFYKAKPTNDEFQVVRTIIEAEEARKQTIEAKISMLRRITKDLTLKQGEREQRLASYRAVIAPINFIPPEILSEIFVHLMEHTTISMMKWRRVVGWISQVNSFWRTAALNTPRLWSTIVSCRPFSAERDLSLVKAWVERAKGFPITFVLQGVVPSVDDPITEVMKIIAPTLHTLILDFKWPLEAVFWALQEEGFIFPHLRRFKASHSISSMTVQRYIPEMMPGLQELSIKECQTFIGNQALNGHWARITDFDGPFMEMGRVVDMFSQAQSLRRCSFDTSIQGYETPAQALQHDTLRTLAFGFSGPGDNVASHLAPLPSFTTLQHLKIDIRLSDDAFNSVHLSPFLMRSGASLCYLQLSSAFTAKELSRCLQCTPRLRFLHLTAYAQHDDEFIKTLAFDGTSSTPIVPELEVLSMAGKVKFLPATVWDVAISRNRPLDSKSASPTDHRLGRPLSYIKLSDDGSLKDLKSRFSTTISRLKKEYGTTLLVCGAAHHLPLQDAQQLLGFKDLDIDASWDWRWGGRRK